MSKLRDMDNTKIIGVFPIMQLITCMDGISLEEMGEVKLLNRYDSKYCLQVSQLNVIVEEVLKDYYVLDIDGTRIQSYSSVYFDTPENRFYLAHHNCKGFRFKIRKRSYLNSGISFTEIKEKTNKGKTIKKRIRNVSGLNEISTVESRFISDELHIDPLVLTAKSKNRFNRITLVSKNFDERCTIDINLVFGMNGETTMIRDFALIELKQGKRNLCSKLALSLKNHHVYPSSFSKYCIGRALLEDGIKKNRFKYKLLEIKREFELVYTEKHHSSKILVHN